MTRHARVEFEPNYHCQRAEMQGHQIRFIESPAESDDDSIVLPPLMRISLQDSELKVIVGDKDLQLARFENWSGERLKKLFTGVAYENWGSE